VKLNQYNIKSATKRIENGIVTYPVFLEVQTTSKKIEQHCVKEFNELLWYTELNINQLYQLQKMKAYIKSNLTDSDKKDILNIFHTKGWFEVPYDLYSWKIIDVRCKMSSDKLPFLLIDAEVGFRMKSILDRYVSNGYIHVKHSGNNITRETAEIYFEKPLPYILIYERSFDIQKEVLKTISEMMGRGSALSKQLSNAIGIENVTSLKKEITWAGDRTIKVVINDFGGLLKAKAKKNWVPLTFAGIIAYDRAQKKKKQELLTKQLNIFKSMQDLVKAAKEDDII